MVGRLTNQKGLDSGGSSRSARRHHEHQRAAGGAGHGRQPVCGHLSNWARGDVSAARLAACIQYESTRWRTSIYAGCGPVPDAQPVRALRPDASSSPCATARCPSSARPAACATPCWPTTTSPATATASPSSTTTRTICCTWWSRPCASTMKTPKTWGKLVRRAMGGKYGWDQSAGVYLSMYRELFPEK